MSHCAADVSDVKGKECKCNRNKGVIDVMLFTITRCTKNHEHLLLSARQKYTARQCETDWCSDVCNVSLKLQHGSRDKAVAGGCRQKFNWEAGSNVFYMKEGAFEG